MFLLARAILCISLPSVVFIDMTSSVLWIYLTSYSSFNILIFLRTCYIIPLDFVLYHWFITFWIWGMNRISLFIDKSLYIIVRSLTPYRQKYPSHFVYFCFAFCFSNSICPIVLKAFRGSIPTLIPNCLRLAIFITKYNPRLATDDAATSFQEGFPPSKFIDLHSRTKNLFHSIIFFLNPK